LYDILRGVRIVEVAGWTFVPAAGAVCADWGADVIKVESPDGGDPQRGLFTSSLGKDSPDVLLQVPNRGKRSLALDIRTGTGRDVLHQLLRTADVFLTNVRPRARERLGINEDTVRALNPRLIYASGTGQGSRGPDADKGGFDIASAFARAGMVHRLTPQGATEPACFPPAFVDLQGGLTIAAGIAAALYHRERTGEATTIDVSLLSVGAWMMSPDIVASGYSGEAVPVRPRAEAANPVVNSYRTSDGRWLYLVLLQADRWWPDFCRHVGCPDLIVDKRFATADARGAHRKECIAEIELIIGSRTLAEWRQAFETLEGVWAPVQSPVEVREDPQVVANGYLPKAVGDNVAFEIVASPIQFGGRPLGELRPAPELGAEGDDLLRELGLSDDEIIELKIAGALQ
jgi:crotonobetainyl-CoA:carnitine CoA-transferase CaiB-like acyl-CoA transferase